MTREVKLRVFAEVAGERRDYVVSLPGETPVVDAAEAASAALSRRLGVKVAVTGVNLHPHWDSRVHGKGHGT